MARSYKRDKNGRFSGGGGGGGGSKGGGKKSGGGGSMKTPKTTSARGRAQANERRAKASLKKSDKAGIADRKAAKSMLVAQAARSYYRRSQSGTKRSPNKASGGSKPAKATVAKAKSAPKAGVADRKKAMSREVTRTMLGGKTTQAQRNPQRERYIGAQNSNQVATSKRGKGSKAARRIAAMKG